MSTAECPPPVYECIGKRIRERRKALNLSQSELADLMGFSYQQMQKYESGTSHISTGKLLLFAKILNVPPSYFYEGIRIEPMGGETRQVISKTRILPFRILLVEDNPTDVISFKKALMECDKSIEIHSESDGAKALEYLRNREVDYMDRLPDLIVLDLSLPRLGGLDFLKVVKNAPRLSELPVVVLTDSISVCDVVQSYRGGAAGFIQKSADSAEYAHAVSMLVLYWSKAVVLPCPANDPRKCGETKPASTEASLIPFPQQRRP